MSNLTEIRIPDIGDFNDVPVIELLVKPGDTVEKETSLITLETDKATMEIPAPQAGVVKEIKVKIGDKVSEGTIILVLETATESANRLSQLRRLNRLKCPFHHPRPNRKRRGCRMTRLPG